MALKTQLNYSPNFNPPKRKEKQIKFIIFHYTGMKKESESLKRLTEIQSEVSSHFFIKKSGEIITLVPELYTAWHAGKSSWKNYKSLNQNSIGIEISNPGHQFKYSKFSKKQIASILRLSKFLIKRYKIYPRNILGHSDIAPERKQDPGEKFPWRYLSQHRVAIWHSLSNKVLKKNRGIEIDKIAKKQFFNDLFKIGYPKKSFNHINKFNYLTLVTMAFQRRYRQEIVNGKIDKECLLISKNLVKKKEY